jgi:RHS repeat-associated protein
LPEGYWQSGTYYYYLKDHLGDNRVTINSSGTVIEKSHYYPSGMRFAPESTSNSAALPYRYNGKELEAMNGLNQYDYGARRRGAGLPIWTAVDPLCEKYYNMSPYAYCMGNPINKTDPNGMACCGSGDNNDDGNNDPFIKHHSFEPSFDNSHGTWDDMHLPQDGQDMLDKINRSGKDDDFNHQPSYFATDANDKGKKDNNSTENSKTAATALPITIAVGDILEEFGLTLSTAVSAVSSIFTGLAVILQGDTSPNQYDAFAQHGINKGKLSTEELEILKQKAANGTLSNADKQKLKRHQKNTKERPSRQSKDDKKDKKDKKKN